MRIRLKPTGAFALLALFALACSLASTAPTVTAPPEELPTEAATLPPLSPETQVPTRALPTRALSTPTATATPTLTPTATLAPATATRPPQSSGPLGFAVTIESCRLDPSRNGGVILTMRIDAQGGSGVYTYYREGQQVSRISDRPATKGTAVIDAYRVMSSDGQSVEEKFRFTGSQFGCP